MNPLKFNIEACKSCGFCIITCPREVLAIGEHINKKGYHYVEATKIDACTSCKLCATMCPDCVIEVYK